MRAKDSAHALATADSRYVFAICGSRTNYVIRPRVRQCSDFFIIFFFSTYAAALVGSFF